MNAQSNETTTFQVISTLANGDTLARPFSTQTEARAYYTTEVAKNTDGRTITITETTTKTVYRLHAPSGAGYSVTGLWLSEDEAKQAIAQDSYLRNLPGAYIAKDVTTTTREATAL